VNDIHRSSRGRRHFASLLNGLLGTPKAIYDPSTTGHLWMRLPFPAVLRAAPNW